MTSQQTSLTRQYITKLVAEKNPDLHISGINTFLQQQMQQLATYTVKHKQNHGENLVKVWYETDFHLDVKGDI